MNSDALAGGGTGVEPVSPTPPHEVRLTTMSQDWADTVFLHWEVDPHDVRRFLPDGVEPDTFEGRTYVGLIGLRIRVALLGLVRIPYFGVFPEINVRVYGVDRHGRRGIVFRSLDAGRLAPTVAARWLYRLPYAWWSGDGTRSGDVVSYAGRRLWPAGGPTTQFSVRVGAAIPEPTPLEHFLTARWRLQWSFLGRTLWCPASHQPWPLRRAELVECADELVRAGGFDVAGAPPMSVLYAPGVTARIGPPRRA